MSAENEPKQNYSQLCFLQCLTVHLKQWREWWNTDILWPSHYQHSFSTLWRLDKKPKVLHVVVCSCLNYNKQSSQFPDISCLSVFGVFAHNSTTAAGKLRWADWRYHLVLITPAPAISVFRNNLIHLMAWLCCCKSLGEALHWGSLLLLPENTSLLLVNTKSTPHGAGSVGSGKSSVI